MNRKIKKYLLIFGYLVAIVAANLLVTFFGPTAVIYSAFFLIGLDLSSRDFLHEMWKGKNLWIKMLCLIFAGSLLSFLINTASLKIAVASFAAFLVSGIVDFIAYTILYKKHWLIKVNGSNIFGSLADSLVFPTLAFGSFMPLIIAGQFFAKFIGGFLWSIVLRRL